MDDQMEFDGWLESRNAAIPEELRSRKQWTTWWYDEASEERFAGRIDDPATWQTFDEVKDRENIAFAVTESDPYAVIHLDDCIDDRGVFSGDAGYLLESMSYAERSPFGVMLFVKGTVPKGLNHKIQLSNGSKLECYDRDRFCCITGEPITSYKEEIAYCGESVINKRDVRHCGTIQSASILQSVCKALANPEYARLPAVQPASPESVMQRASILIDCETNTDARSIAAKLFQIFDDEGNGLTDGDAIKLLKRWKVARSHPAEPGHLKYCIRQASLQAIRLRKDKGIQGSDDDAADAAMDNHLKYSGRDWADDFAQKPSRWQRQIEETTGIKAPRTMILDEVPIDAARNYPHILEGFWPLGMMMLISGASKTCKTRLMINLSFQLVTGGNFLGRYPVGTIPNAGPDDGWNVLVFSCESGVATIRKQWEHLKDNYVRSMLERGEIPEYELDQGSGDPFMVNLRIMQKRFAAKEHLTGRFKRMLDRMVLCDQPLLITRDFVDSQEQQDGLRALIVKNRSRVVFIDPEYLQIDADRIDASKTGILYNALCKVCASVGATLAIVAHNKAPSKENPQRGYPTLNDVAYSGLKQSPRVWMLINRFSEYRNDGRHELLLTLGNSDSTSDRLYVELRETKSSMEIKQVLGEGEWRAARKQQRDDEKRLETSVELLGRYASISSIVRDNQPISRSSLRSKLKAKGTGIGDDTLQGNLASMAESKQIKSVSIGTKTYWTLYDWKPQENQEHSPPGLGMTEKPKKPRAKRHPK